SNELTQVVRTNQLTGTTDFTRIKEIDIVLICVPTPIDKYKQPNLSYIVDSIETLIQYVKKGSLILFTFSANKSKPITRNPSIALVIA
ncbi:hypothetical protein ACUOAQ_31590, partial [Escherichia sp. SP-MK]